MGRESGVEIPTDHPRYQSLVTRHRIEHGLEKGLTSRQGLIAQGRGEAFDYLIGEETIPSARDAEKAAAAELLLADHPVVSTNGNASALVPGELVELAEVIDGDIEVNLFHRTEPRVRSIIEHLGEFGGTDVKGLAGDATIPGLSHDRAIVDETGIYSADVVLVPLEDGDRAEALSAMGKTEIVIDLNPLSRSAQTADIPIIDNIIRAVPTITGFAREFREVAPSRLEDIVSGFDREETLRLAEEQIRSR